eukprot:4500740-Amphidinium_carterae.1
MPANRRAAALSVGCLLTTQLDLIIAFKDLPSGALVSGLAFHFKLLTLSLHAKNSRHIRCLIGSDDYGDQAMTFNEGSQLIQAQFVTTSSWYSANPPRWRQFAQQLIHKLRIHCRFCRSQAARN